tara:strand:- start:333 stop:578 length:246 start_codon:yes stop_codon:yes gene_type:complete
MGKMINNWLLCEAETSNNSISTSGFETTDALKFVMLKVVESSDDSIIKGDSIVVPVTSPEEIKIKGINYLAVNIGNVIWYE